MSGGKTGSLKAAGYSQAQFRSALKSKQVKISKGANIADMMRKAGIKPANVPAK